MIGIFHRTVSDLPCEEVRRLGRLAYGLTLKVKGKQTVPTMMFRAALSIEFRTAIIEQIIKSNF
ncbi:MAG: hypothetical protein FWE67_10425 [Planctomycetaceae bacterium]|nr:hypothetical protein [Planctomycetaceae bacterium]